MITGLVVLKMVLMPSRQRLASLANSGPRWSMIGVSIARSTRSGSGVGPGIWRKWRPTLRAEFWAIGEKLRLRGGFWPGQTPDAAGGQVPKSLSINRQLTGNA